MLLHHRPLRRDTEMLSSSEEPRSLDEITQTQLEHVDFRYEASLRTAWANLLIERSTGRSTSGLLSDVLSLQGVLAEMLAFQVNARHDPMQYFVFGSRTPSIYNLGGDIVFFADRIRQGDKAAMHAYAHLCIDVILMKYNAFHLPIVTIALVQGDALGGGFEDALSHDVLIAERSARLGLPEILFNLFPGMGAYSFLSRRIGAQAAERMIMSGTLYTGAQLHEMGVVDVLAADGEGEAAVRDYIDRSSRKFNAQQALYRTRRLVSPVTEAELRGVVDIWVETAMSVGDADLRKMERLAQAQKRRLRAGQEAHLHAAE